MSTSTPRRAHFSIAYLAIKAEWYDVPAATRQTRFTARSSSSLMRISSKVIVPSLRRRSSSVERIALGCSLISLDMKSSWPPFSAVSRGRLRRYRLDRARAALDASDCGAFLLFDFYNIRYTTQTWIGGALGDKMTRYALLTRGGGPPPRAFG